MPLKVAKLIPILLITECEVSKVQDAPACNNIKTSDSQTWHIVSFKNAK